MISEPTAVPELGAARPLHVVAKVGGERFAFPVTDVEEAIDAPQIDWVPGAARGLAGQVRYRDRTVSAFDGGWALGVTRTADGGTALILRDGTRRITHITEVQGMEGDIITLQDIFLFDFAAGVDEMGKYKGQLKPTGVRPKFTEKLADQGIRLGAEIFSTAPAGARPALQGR